MMLCTRTYKKCGGFFCTLVAQWNYVVKASQKQQADFFLLHVCLYMPNQSLFSDTHSEIALQTCSIVLPHRPRMVLVAQAESGVELVHRLPYPSSFNMLRNPHQLQSETLYLDHNNINL